MSGILKADKPKILTPPSEADERQRKLAQEARKETKGVGTSMLTQGLALRTRSPAGQSMTTKG